jgi:hypothetical protein
MPTPETTRPCSTEPLTSLAKPYAATPSAIVIHASLPMPDDQNAIEGRKNTSIA